MIKVYCRENNEFYYETQYGEKKLQFLYNTVIGRFLLKIAVSKVLSNISSLLNSTPKSTKKIPGFISKYNINTDDFEKKEYSSFNDFFIRKIKKGRRSIYKKPDRLISPADSKMLVYNINDQLKLNIKNSVYSIDELLNNKSYGKLFDNGLCLVFRLTVDDYHRYCFVENGKIMKRKSIDGKLHTVSSISSDYKVFAENKREYSLINTIKMGNIIQMEIGAMLVGRIINHKTSVAVKGAEKGYFAYGGSTIILLIQSNKVKIDGDILMNSVNGIETKIRYGETIGTII